MTNYSFVPDPITDLLLYEGIGETLCLALNGQGKPAALFIERWHEQSYFLRLGLEADAIVREIMPAKNGAFVGVQHGVEVWAFMAMKPGTKLVIGERIPVRVVSEPYGDKSARVVRCPPPPKSGRTPPPAIESWMDALIIPEGVTPASTTEIDVFEDALDWGETLWEGTPSGATIRFGCTDALTAIDIDSSRWHVKRPPKERARIVNGEAVRTVARELSYRSLGGLSVLDCIGPIDSEDKKPLKDLMIKSWRNYRHGPMQVLAPSALGLMEMSFARTTAPLHMRLFDPGTMEASPATLALKAFRDAEADARVNRTKQITIRLPDLAYAWHKQHEKAHMEAFQARYGARISIEASD